MTTDTGLTLRERKKLRTRRALVEEALRLFTEQGFGETTLDELVDAVDVSQRTFFRNFSSKEDVALAPEKELWTTYLAELERRPPGASTLADYQDTLFAAIGQMTEGWERRFLASRALCDRTPALVAHSLRHCSEITERALAVVAARRPAPDAAAALHDRLLLELMLAAWRWAIGQWAAAGEVPCADDTTCRAELRAHVRRAFGAIPGTARLACPEHSPEHGPERDPGHGEAPRTASGGPEPR
ncbi:TetR/AcrR family transcriptional regulator [Streptomyces litchfieldiae]|uniref:Helix-turn-helix domain-containing protein n=1 Tax=Streptomyces litchfieldiae TaxID=3075543 RepID=A0ABU2N188_9ACTN|nr:helix-turn-helix domain-containing protein [Streptomyces sp. DSM 44938]MDT0346838.1 helix-turn-helix domain-containing protein [Streptomyces sp. DSM 44938]